MPDRAWSRSTRCVGDEVADVVSLHADGRPGNASESAEPIEDLRRSEHCVWVRSW